MTEIGGGARTVAPAKVNAALLVGPVRPQDGRHDLASVMQSLSLVDDVSLVPSGAGADEIDCPGVPGDNLALDALRAYRDATGWDAPPLSVRIVKRIPVAAGMAGGSNDAAAVLRLAAFLHGTDDDALLHRLAAGLGADVAHGLRPGLALAAGAGERLERFPGALPGALVVLRSASGLSTPRVFRRADELRPPRDAHDLADWLDRLRAALAGRGAGPVVPEDLAVNDLQDAAIDLDPDVAVRLGRLRAHGARPAMVSGSGPTVVGWFGDEAAAETARRGLAAGGTPAEVARPITDAPIERVPG